MLTDAYLELVQAILEHQPSVTDSLTEEGQVVGHLLSQGHKVCVSLDVFTLFLQFLQLLLSTVQVTLQVL